MNDVPDWLELPTFLVRVTSSYFCAGLVLNISGYVTETAPILKRYRGQPWADVARKLRKRGFDIEIL